MHHTGAKLEISETNAVLGPGFPEESNDTFSKTLMHTQAPIMRLHQRPVIKLHGPFFPVPSLTVPSLTVPSNCPAL